jgi:hypothetical protein
MCFAASPLWRSCAIRSSAQKPAVQNGFCALGYA